MIVPGNTQQLKDALRVAEAIARVRRSVASQYWVFTGGLARALGLEVFYQGKN